MNDIVIRRGSAADWPAIINMTGVWEAEDISFGVRRDTPDDLDGCTIWIAETDGRPVGFAAGREDKSPRKSSILAQDERYFELEELYVLPEMRKSGLGNRLFAAAQEYARAQGYRRMLLSTSTKDTLAMLRFYVQKEGMRVWSMRLFKDL